MLKFCVPLSLAVAGLLWTAPVALAQIDADRAVPAEFPPASYTARQYVDSRGCVYVRAGVDGATQWVPRVARNRQVICGFTPSLSGAAAQTATATPAVNPNVVQITPVESTEEPATSTETAAAPGPAPAAPRVQTPEPATTTATPSAPAPPATTTARASNTTTATQPAARAVTPSAPRTQATTQNQRRSVPTVRRPQQTTTRTPTAQAQPATRPRRIEVAPVQPAPVRRVQTGDCQGASAISNQYIQRGPGVRCGPQTQPIVTLKPTRKTVRLPNGNTRTIRNRGAEISAGTSGATSVNGQTIIAPRTAYEERRGISYDVPEGYKPAFEDGRINPRRGYQTVDGRRVMLLTWSNTVPRVLIDKLSGENVTARFPDLRYPYTSPRQQAEAEGRISARQTAKRQPAAIQPTQTQRASAVTPRAPATQPASHRYVQTGPFHADQAYKVVNRFRSAGLSVKIGEITRNGKAYRYVLAGPYDTQSALNAGQARVQGLGYATKLRQ
ncbi:MAG: SPOR domain-containing protein [Marinovum sp.]|nr:SPOR domain-containing protein [Marinovum sp.]